jgi:HSP20 family protein
MVLERWRPGWDVGPFKPFWLSSNGDKEFIPALDIFEKDSKFIVKAELPGMKEKDIQVSVVGDTLTIKGEKEAESEIDEENYYRLERSYGSFARSISIPSYINTERIEANFENGILEISMPKFAEIKPKKVKVSARKSEK